MGMFIWKAARENVKGYPLCPEDMSEVDLVRLLYTKECFGEVSSPPKCIFVWLNKLTRIHLTQGCVDSACDEVYWDLRVRYCTRCAQNMKDR